MNLRLRKACNGFMACCLFLFLCPIVGWAQNAGELKGTVKDAEGKPVAGASIVVKGTSKGTNSSTDGSFTLTSAVGSYTLEISCVGYKSKTIEITNGQTTFEVVLEETKSQLGEVVVVGYGTQKRSNVTGSVASVRNKDFKDQPVSNVAQSIQGKMPGVLVTQPSGTPGGGLLVSIRGASNPLYVVDGVPMISESNSALSTSYNTDGEGVGQGQNISSISDINPDDIESIQILKDASSASIYGARAANGVVLITTKRGRAGKTEFAFNSFAGVQKVARKIPFLDSKGFVDLVEDARAQDLAIYQKDPSAFEDLYPGFDPAVLTNPLPDSWKTGVNTDWQDEIFRPAPMSNIQLSARGGNDKTKFFVAGNYFDQNGIIIENSYKRGTFRLNVDNKVSDHISIGANSSFTYARNRRSFNDNTYTGIVTNALGASPLEPVYNADGSYSDFTEYQASWLSDNPIKSAKEIKAFTTNYRYLGTVFLDAELLKDLKFRTSFTADYSNVIDDQFFDPSTTDGETVGGKAIKATYKSLTWLSENTLTYATSFKDKHHITALAGFSVQSSRYDQTNILGYGFPAGSGLENLGSASSIVRAPANNFGWGIASFFGRLNYDFDEKYLLSLSLRNDGSSRFADGHRWGLFPAVSAGWVISKEHFLIDNSTLTNLKLRFSYGLSGDQEIGDFRYKPYWIPTRYDGIAGFKPGNIGNPELTWQRNKMLNIGIDFEINNGKFGGSLEYYKGNRTQLLTQTPLPATSGFPSILTNAGNIENQGVEFSLYATPVKNKSFTWNTSMNISYLKNTIKSLNSDNELLSAYTDLFPTHILKIGESTGSFWGYKYLGVDPTTGDPMYSDNEQILGKATPDWYGGWTNDFKYKNWDASIVSQFSIGNKVYNLIKATYQTVGWSDGGWDENNDLYQVYANNATSVNNRWKNPGDQTDIPRASLIFANYLQNSSQFIENASFFRIRTANIGYTIRPKQSKVFRSLRLYAQVQNLAVFTGYYGYDPEVSSTGGGAENTAGVDYAAYPKARTFTFGVNFNF